MIAVIDYGIGNLRSAEKAFERLEVSAQLVDEPDALADVDGVVLPGVGAFGRCAEALDAGGWRQAIHAVVDAGVPLFGICVGFQLLYDESDESPGAQGLGVLQGRVRRLGGEVKLPQIQWNRVERSSASTLFPDQSSEEWMYFVHSFAPPVGEETVAVCEYGGEVAAAVESATVFGTQFHPEKSGSQGLALLGRFAAAVGG